MDDDSQLVRDAVSITEAFLELYRRNITRVYRYHMAHTGNVQDAEDLTSQTFLGALTELSSFRRSDSFAEWILRIAAKKRIKDVRGNRRELPNDAVLYYQSSGLPADRAAMRRMEMEELTRALKQLPLDQTEAVILHFFGELTNSEISRVLKKLEGNDLIDKLSYMTDQIVPDPLFVSELEQALITSYPHNKSWTFSLKQVLSLAIWVVFIGLAVFMLNGRNFFSPPVTQQKAATSSATHLATKVAPTKTASSPRIPTARPTATRFLSIEYKVQSGDTCTYIADKFGLEIDRLINLNRLNSACDIWVDQILVIPIIPTPTPSN
ncbi:MAG: sigma-70 family RNA polymerase sigma factor [Chloroflexota bacterium]